MDALISTCPSDGKQEMPLSSADNCSESLDEIDVDPANNEFGSIDMQQDIENLLLIKKAIASCVKYRMGFEKNGEHLQNHITQNWNNHDFLEVDNEINGNTYWLEMSYYSQHTDRFDIAQE
jgi:hypothetical protein